MFIYSNFVTQSNLSMLGITAHIMTSQNIPTFQMMLQVKKVKMLKFVFAASSGILFQHSS